MKQNNTHNKRLDKWMQLVCLATCLMILVAGAIRRDGRIWGHTLGEKQEERPAAAAVEMRGDTTLINTTAAGASIQGYAGTVPLEVGIVDGHIVSVTPLDNVETPNFFDRAMTVLDPYMGLSAEEAMALDVDLVSGATFSSQALVDNMRLALQSYADLQDAAPQPDGPAKNPLTAKYIVSLIVLLLAMIVPLVRKNSRWRLLQLGLNVAVLGLWCGTFISYSSLIGLISNGPRGWSTLPLLLMVATAFVYPLFGKKNHYCMQVCPFGSAQELAGKLSKRRWAPGPKTIKILSVIRVVLWGVLMLLMIAAAWSEWMDYELFTAFIFQSASVTVIVLAALCLVLSVFVPRPYCRFVCPTGTLLKVSQKNEVIFSSKKTDSCAERESAS